MIEELKNELKQKHESQYKGVIVSVNKIDKEIHNIISEWGLKKNYNIMPFQYMPEHSYVVFLDDKPCLFGSLYYSVEKVLGFPSYFISNPDANRDEISLCFDPLIESLDNVGRSLGLKFLFTTTCSASLASRFVNSGFTLTDTDAVHLLKEI